VNAEQTSDVEKKRLALVEVHRSGYVVDTRTMAEGRRVYAVSQQLTSAGPLM
jgi:hypothetical protein